MCCYTFSLVSQVRDSLPSKAESYLKLDYENDFFSATDRYYTQGIFLSFVHPVVKYSPFSYSLIRLSKQAVNMYGLQLEQDVFTPRSIRYSGGLYNTADRPFTAFFLISHNLTSYNADNEVVLFTQLDLGIIGPEGKGEEEQKGIHKALDNIQPQGWENQLSTDYILNYRATLEKGIIQKKRLEIITTASARLGTLYTDLGLGFKTRLGIFNPYFTGRQFAKNTRGKKSFKLYLEAAASGKVVGYNATLQGGITNSGNVYELPDSSVNRFVANLSASLVVTYKRVRLEYGRMYVTPEFKGGLDHGWGRCSIAVCF